ncbi:MAG TPA: DUF2336 domain-containing protein [Pseudolabrys sp.]|jgi:uncharacterized protein (DUF2336 family)|nr:DUF2336 domain-containing protein [Pseudolabrys sp.]
MGVPASLLPELEEVIQHGSATKRAETLRRITTLFLESADRINDDHVALFDDVMCCLIEEIEAKVLAELAQRIAPVPNAPGRVVRTLAHHDDIAVAGPVIAEGNLPDPVLVQIAETKSQAHLLAMSSRKGISTVVSDVLVERGNHEVTRSLAGNRHANLSERALTTLVERAEQDDVLAERVGLRTDIPPRLFRQLLMQATEVVQKRLLAKATPEMQIEIRRVLAKVSQEVGNKAAPRSYTAALEMARALNRERKLREAEVATFARAGRYEETIAALATLCAVPVEAVDRLLNGDRPDPVLILARAAGFSWQTVRDILTVIAKRSGSRVASSQALEAAQENFERLTPGTAQRVVRFWQVRQGMG